MARDLGGASIARASEAGVPGIGGADPWVLAHPAFGADESLTLKLQAEGPIAEWGLVLDLYVPQPSGSFVSLLQTGTGDGDVFLRDNGDGTAGVGISGVYDGAVPFDAWARIALVVTQEGGETVLRKFVNGALVGEQALGATSRWTIDPETGLRLLTDNDGETAPGFLSSVFFTQELPSPDETAGILASIPQPTADGVFPAAPSATAVQIDFTDGDVAPTFGAAEVIVEGFGFRTPVSVGDSAIGFASQLGIEGPGGVDVPVLAYPAFDAEEGLRLGLPDGAPDLASWTAVWDIRLSDAAFGFKALLQTDATNSGDGELFVRGDGGLGINGDYDGAVPREAWSRIAVTVSDNGDGTATLAKYLDGALLDTQSVDAARFTLRAEGGFLLLTDNDGETAPGHLAHFGVAPRALAPAEIAAMGGADGDGPFDPAEPFAAQLGFDGYAAGLEFGAGSVELVDASGGGAPALVGAIPDLLAAEGDDPSRFDLTSVFGEGATGFAVEGANAAVSATIEGSTLTLTYGALGVADLVITATGADGEALSDSARIRVAGENAYTIAIMPDTQDYTSNPGIRDTFSAMTQWMADNAAGKKIGFVTHVGDIVQNARPAEFDVAREAMDILRDAGIPFSVLPGNHDFGDGGSANRRFYDAYDAAFSTTYMAEDPTFAGTYDVEPGSYVNNYHLWDAPDGTGWLILNLEFGPRDDVLRWADGVLREHGDRKAFVLTHSQMNFDGRHDSLGAPLNAEGAGYDYGIGNDPRGAQDGEALWREVLKKHPNVAFTAGGHIFGDGAETLVSYNDFGAPVHQFLVNYQNGVANEINGAGNSAEGGDGGNGAIRLVIVDPDNDAFHTETYFTEFDSYFTAVRGDGTLSRDGLTGPYPGHEETYEGVALGERAAQPIADAGDDVLARAEAGASTATVALDAGRTTDPRGDLARFVWTDEDGAVLAEGATAEIMLPAGVHDLTLTVETAGGVRSSDRVRVIVETDASLLTETFDDGDIDGWTAPAADPAPFVALGTDLGFSLPSIDGVAQIPLRLTFDSHWRPEDSQIATVSVSFDGGATLVELLRYDSASTQDDGSNQNETVTLDILAPAGAGSAQAFFRMLEAGNDWFWAIDNVSLTADDGAVTLLAEDFDGLAGALRPAVDENIDALGWTHDAPEGWARSVADSTPPGTTEWRGWSFVTPEFWTSADGQDRANFTKGTGVIAVADPDEWDDFNGGSETSTDFDTTLATPAVSLEALGGGDAGGEAAGVARIDALSPIEGLLVTPEAGGRFDAWTMIFDLYVADGQGTWTSLLQTDPTNGGDGDLFLRRNADGGGGVGISGVYDGAFAYGAWNRVAFAVSVEEGAQVLRKYIDGALVGEQTVDGDVSDGSRWTLDGDAGFLLFTDEDGETSEVYASAFAFTPGALDGDAIAALGGVDVDGPLDAAPVEGAFQLSFDGALDATDFGAAAVAQVSLGSGETPYLVKGTAASRGAGDGLPAPTGALYDQSNREGNFLLWDGGAFGDQVIEATLTSLDDDTMGFTFRYNQSTGDHYRLEMDSQQNFRRLLRVEDGAETVLAEEAGGYRFYDAIDLKIRAIGGEIGVTLDGVALFGGPVSDPAPLPAGTVGVFSSSMDAAIFDDIVVRRPTDEADAGPDQWLIDFDGDGVETATLDARMSVGDAQWAGLSEGALVQVTVGAEGATFTAEVGDSADEMRVQVATGERLVAADRFEDGDFAGWRIVDETELGGPADWAVVDGALVEQSGAWSRELTWAGASNPDVWQRGWSPLGDGVFALHKGTYALWEGDKGLDDYMIRATVTAADAEGGVGFMLNWIDEDNHYKLEIDAHANLTTLVKVVDGYESYLNRVRTVYTPGESFELMAVREDDAIQVYIDGHAIFAEAVEDRDLGAGQAGVYAWKSAGASFDDVAIVDLSEPEAPTLGVFGLLDALVREGQPQTYDLAALFPGASGFSVTTADGDVVAATIADGVLTLDPQARGHADLVLTGLAADGSAIAESFRAIVVGEHAYTFAVMPDTQSYTSTSNPEVRALFGQMADWLLAHQESLNIAHMIHVGDIVEFGAPGQWEIARDAIARLDGKLSYTLAVGNHDQQRPGFSSAFAFESDIDAYFTPEQVGATPEQGGGTYDGFDVGEDTFANGSDYAGSIRNHFTTLTAPDGTDWLILSLEFGAPDDVLRWAGEVIEGHLDHRVIIDTHSWNGGDKRVDPTTEPLTGENGGWGYAIRANPRNVNDGEDMWRELASKYPNIVFTFNGHNFLDGAETVTSLAAGDNPVLQIMVNYQNGISGEITGAGDPALGGRGGNGAMRLVVIDPDNGEVTTHTKFVGLDRYFERVDHQETFTGLDLGAPETITIAKAGGTLVVEAEGLEATVALDPSASLEARATVYAWFDADGEKLGETDGAPLDVALKPGLHRLTLVATDAEGNVSRDAKTVIVEAEGGALLTDTFDDGDAAGWSSPAAAAPDFATLGTDLGFALPALGAVEQVALTLAFDSHWRPFDAMTGEVLVSFDGGATLAQVLRFGSDNTNDADFRDQRVELDFLAPLSAEGVTLAWRLSDADNDWYWAIDNIALTTADGATALFAEDFESLADQLQPAVDENTDVVGWTHEAPEGWTRTVAETTPQGATEWRGWSFATLEFWTAADQQARGEFTKASGVFAIADPDEWDDFNGGQAGQPDSFDSTIATPVIDLAPVGGGAGVGEAAGVMRVDALGPDAGLLVTPEGDGPFEAWTMVWDILIPDGGWSFASLLQTDLANAGDADIYLLNAGDGTAGVGISGDYDGPIGLGDWARLALTLTVENGAQVLRKYLDGALLDTQTVDGNLADGSRWTLDADGFLLFAEPANFTSTLYLGAFAFAPEALSGAAIAALGGADLDGPFAESPVEGAVQFNFDAALDGRDFGTAGLEQVRIGDAETSFLVKGSIFGNPDGRGEAAVYAQTNGANEVLLWGGEGSESWSDYVFDVAVHPADNDTIGVVFYWTGEGDHYELTLDTQTFERVLTRVSGGERHELAREAGGYRHHAEQTLRVAVSDGRIWASLDDHQLFGDPVADPEPLAGGTVGLLSRFMDRVSFDNVSVNPLTLQAEARGDRRAVDLDGDGEALFDFTAHMSIGPDAFERIEWLVDGAVVAEGGRAMLSLPVGETVVTLRVTDIAGKVSEDAITVEAIARAAVLLAEDFDGATAIPPGWTVVDEGTLDAPSDWSVDGGALVQGSNIGSAQQQTGFGAWSLGGEGAFILREGTQAVWSDPAAQAWADYRLDATITPQDDDGVGVMVRYVDAENHYKLELDEQAGVVQLLATVDGYETVLARGWGGYAPGAAMDWSVTVQGSRITAEIDGARVFESEVDDFSHAAGTVALYSWSSAGVAFDDVVVTRIGAPALLRIEGVGDRDRLEGTDADEILATGAGRSETATGGGGADVFLFGVESVNGVRELDQILDYAPGEDAIAVLGGLAGIESVRESGGGVRLTLAGDGDTVFVRGVRDADLLTILDAEAFL